MNDRKLSEAERAELISKFGPELRQIRREEDRRDAPLVARAEAYWDQNLPLSKEECLARLRVKLQAARHEAGRKFGPLTARAEAYWDQNLPGEEVDDLDDLPEEE